MTHFSLIASQFIFLQSLYYHALGVNIFVSIHMVFTELLRHMLRFFFFYTECGKFVSVCASAKKYIYILYIYIYIYGTGKNDKQKYALNHLPVAGEVS